MFMAAYTFLILLVANGACGIQSGFLDPINVLQPSVRQRKIVAYWEGYKEGGVKPYPLSKVPHNIDYIPIAFVAPRFLPGEEGGKASGWEFDKTFVYTTEEVWDQVRMVNNRNNSQKILFSLLDTPTCHWDHVDIPKFARNIVKDAKLHGIHGFDMDIESGMAPNKFAETFIWLIKAIKGEDPSMIVTYVTAGNAYDETILGETKHLLEFVTTMRYWDTQEDLFRRYSKIVGPEKVGVGVMTNTTTLSMVQTIGRFTGKQGSKLMMLWSLTRDVRECSCTKNGRWFDEINKQFLHAGQLSSIDGKHDNHETDEAEMKELLSKLKNYHPKVSSLRELRKAAQDSSGADCGHCTFAAE